MRGTASVREVNKKKVMMTRLEIQKLQPGYGIDFEKNNTALSNQAIEELIVTLNTDIDHGEWPLQ